MKDTPIRFLPSMRLAILDDRKTMTRRPINSPPDVTEDFLRKVGAWTEGMTLSEHVNSAWQHGFIDEECKYGNVGDRVSLPYNQTSYF